MRLCSQFVRQKGENRSSDASIARAYTDQCSLLQT